MKFSLLSLFILGACCFNTCNSQTEEEDREVKKFPNIILIMTDDQGWGETGYYGHPVLKTPQLDEMASNGLQFDRFYAAPNCSPARASILTGRSSDRTGVFSHGFALRLQEKVLPVMLREVGYTTGHFGKWHLNGLKGPGAPIFADDPHSPGAFGFNTWLSATNYFDIDPILSRNGKFEEFQGTSSEIIMDEALDFITSAVKEEIPFFTVIWDGSPHAPFVAEEADIQGFENLDENSAQHYGELVALDRSLGKLRNQLRALGVAKNTIVWFCSDNGGLKGISPSTTGELRGHKGTLWEGGIRVPGIIEWPLRISAGKTDYPVSILDIVPTIVDILELPKEALLSPIDGQSIKPLILNNSIKTRSKPIPFRFGDQGAWIDNDYKLIATSIKEKKFELYNLSRDPMENHDISKNSCSIFKNLKKKFLDWNESVEKSISGYDYPENKVRGGGTKSHFWMEDKRYFPFLKKWGKRPEYSGQYRGRKIRGKNSQEVEQYKVKE